MSTAVTFYQLAAPLMLFNTGEVYANGAVFLTYIMNLMQFIYIYSWAYFYTKLTLWIESGNSISGWPINSAAPSKKGKKW